MAAAFGDQPRPPRWRDFSPAQRCFSDGLALAFSFLSLFELIPAARACRSWRETALKADVPGVELRDVTKGADGSARLRSLVSSPFRRHVHALIDTDAFSMHTDDARPPPEWTLLDLAMMQHLPQLRRLSGVSVELASTLPGEAFSFPPLLNKADLYLSFDDELLDEDDESRDTAPVQRLVLAALRPCRSLTELSITLLPSMVLCLGGLLELSALEILTIDIEHAGGETDDGNNPMFTEAHISVIKQLSCLRRLKLLECEDLDPDEEGPLGTRWLRWLCPMPHRLQRLEELDLSQHFLFLAHMQLLQLLPALTALGPVDIQQSALPVLPAFASRLKRLELVFGTWEDEADAAPGLFDSRTGFARSPLFMPHLAPCAALTRLSLSICVFTEDDATALCQALPQLRELELIDVGWPSFEPLRHLPLLESFSLTRARSYPLHTEAVHFPPLQRLRHLALTNMPTLSDAAKSAIDSLRPPSALLPALVDFTLAF